MTEYVLRPSPFFLEQFAALHEDEKRIIRDKISLAKENPYRNKAIKSNEYKRVFRIRIRKDNQDARLIYVLLEPDIILVCMMYRKDDYRELEKFLKNPWIKKFS